MAGSKRILSYAKPAQQVDRPTRADHADRADRPDDAGPPPRILRWIFAVCVLTVACIAGMFAIGPVSALDSRGWRIAQEVLAIIAAVGMLVVAVFSLCEIVAKWWHEWVAWRRGG